MKRVKKKYQTPVIHSIELGPISPVTASPGGGVTIPVYHLVFARYAGMTTTRRRTNTVGKRRFV